MSEEAQPGSMTWHIRQTHAGLDNADCYACQAALGEIESIAARLHSDGKWVIEYGRPAANGRIAWHGGKMDARDTLQRRVWRERPEPIMARP